MNERPECHPAIIVVAGVSSGAGKTSLAEALITVLARSRRTAAAKITVTHGTLGCPHGGKSCNVCSSLGGDFQIVTSKGILEQAGTDTARLKLSGADPVLWAITKSDSVGEAWDEMKKQFQAESVVVESNTLASCIKPDLLLMIADPTVSRKIWKPSAERLIAEADVLVVNNRGSEKQREALLHEIEHLREDRTKVVFLTHPCEAEGNQTILDELSAIGFDQHSDLDTAVVSG